MDTGPSSAAVDTHVAWIRERLSARGIDPYAQPSLTAEVIDEALDALSGPLPPQVRDDRARELMAEVAGLGPL